MNKNKKISLLIYKKLDNTISEKELKILNKYIEKDENLKEELKLTESIAKELKNVPQVDLPPNFKSSLREKITDYNLSKTKEKNKRIWLPVTTVATSLAAVLIIVMAFGNSGLYGKRFTDVNKSYEAQSEAYGTTDVTKNAEENKKASDNNPKKADMSNSNNQKMTRQIEGYENQNAAHTETSQNNELNGNYNEQAATQPIMLDIDTNAADTVDYNTNKSDNDSSNITDSSADSDSSSPNRGSSGGGGGGGASSSTNTGSSGGGGGASSPVFSVEDDYEFATISVHCDINVFNNIILEKTPDNNIYKVSMTDYSAVKELINTFSAEIKGDTATNLIKEYFLLEIISE